MSVRIMSAVWERQDITPTQKLVLLAFADWANDEGLCWPSIERVCVKSSLTRRTVQVAIRDLSEMGLLVQEKSTGRSCKYWITLGAQEMHPCSSSAPEAQEKRPRGAGDAPNTSYTHQLTVKEDMSSDDDLTVDDVVEVWNDMAEQCGLAKVVKLTEVRRKKIKARIKEYSVDDWSKAMNAIYNSKFLRGENDRGWKADFDFLLEPSKFIKLLEGTYDR